jgi:hypothetical protein
MFKDGQKDLSAYAGRHIRVLQTREDPSAYMWQGGTGGQILTGQ